MDFTEFRKNLSQIITTRGCSINAFARDIGIPAATIARYINGDRQPELAYVVKIADYLQVSVDWLIGLSVKKINTMPSDLQDLISKYSVATADDKRVVQAVLNKYNVKGE